MEFIYQPIPDWLTVLTVILLLCALFALAIVLLEPRLRGFTHTNPKPKTKPPLRVGQAPMSPFVRNHSKEIARAVRSRQQTIVVDGVMYEIKEIDAVYPKEENNGTKK